MTSSSGAEYYEPVPTSNSAGYTLPAPAPAPGPMRGRALGELPPPAEPGPVVAPLPPAASAPSASPVGPGGPRLGRREKWVELPAKTEDGQDAYPGFRIKLWLNYPQHWDQDMTGANFRPAPEYEGATIAELRAWSDEREASMREAYGRVVLEHNGWLDYDGNVLPQPQDPRFWELIPTELAATIVALQKQATAELPNSIQPRRRR